MKASSILREEKLLFNAFEDEILKRTELKLLQKERNTMQKPYMLEQARKYFNKQGQNMPNLGYDEVVNDENSRENVNTDENFIVLGK
jgi:hypothetical protein